MKRGAAEYVPPTSPSSSPPSSAPSKKSKPSTTSPLAIAFGCVSSTAAPSSSFSGVFDTGGAFGKMVAEATVSNPPPTTATTGAAAAGAFSSSGFSSFADANPFKAASEAASGSAFASSGFSSFADANPFKAASAAASKEDETDAAEESETKSDEAKPSDAVTDDKKSSSDEEAASPAEKTDVLDLDRPVEVNGEEDAKMLLQQRIKSFKLNADPTANGGWAEMGIGPMRILSSDTPDQVRLVMRRETTPGGMGTKVLINVQVSSVTDGADEGVANFDGGCVYQPEGKFCRVGAPASKEGGGVEITSYLLKFKSEGERDTFMRTVEAHIS